MHNNTHMSPQKAYQQIKSLIQQTNDAYSIFWASDNANVDYAEFASQSFNEFKTVLQRPEMTQRQLGRLLRHGSYEHRAKAPKSCWASFLARYVTDTANGNVEDTV